MKPELYNCLANEWLPLCGSEKEFSKRQHPVKLDGFPPPPPMVLQPSYISFPRYEMFFFFNVVVNFNSSCRNSKSITMIWLLSSNVKILLRMHTLYLVHGSLSGFHPLKVLFKMLHFYVVQQTDQIRRFKLHKIYSVWWWAFVSFLFSNLMKSTASIWFCFQEIKIVVSGSLDPK